MDMFLHTAMNKLKVNDVCECIAGKCVSILPKLAESIRQQSQCQQLGQQSFRK
ncbi:hypothetical protein [Geosporobacter ferrireducens]|uniref:hypothetical protein n=1 Tax=Geosporobacter ferrireducens TaxID=1424294 RepID=UPI0012E9B8AE|nr:hypothetical protein [Geosporobacter ferrireducens]